jgi:hypothetical protein
VSHIEEVLEVAALQTRPHLENLLAKNLSGVLWIRKLIRPNEDRPLRLGKLNLDKSKVICLPKPKT